MTTTYGYRRTLPDGTSKSVGAFAKPSEARRMVAHALVDNGYARKREAAEFATRLPADGTPRTHEGSGVTYAIHAGQEETSLTRCYRRSCAP